jgi:hypothetical protein
MKALVIALAAACLMTASAAGARADTIFLFSEIVDIVEPMSWAGKLKFMKDLGGTFKKECRKDDGCAMVARSPRKPHDLTHADLILIEPFPVPRSSVANYRQWCVKERESWRMRCIDEKPDDKEM